MILKPLKSATIASAMLPANKTNTVNNKMRITHAMTDSLTTNMANCSSVHQPIISAKKYQDNSPSNALPTSNGKFPPLSIMAAS